jgi:CO/xanthine dehydrogenase Mo-binding subunit
MKIFCSGTIKYAGQAVGLILADTREIALKAADLVSVEYKKSDLAPVLSINEVLHHAGNRIHVESKGLK